MIEGIFFASPEHRERLAEAIERLEKVERDGTADPWYGAALYILSADLYTWDSVQPYISRSGIKFDDILENIHFSSGYITLIETAANLFRDDGQIDLSRFTNLDEDNFRLVIDAIKIRRYSLQASNFNSEERRVTESEVNETIHALLEQLPAGYPPATFSNTTTGYRLEIDHTIIFQGASGEDAIKHTDNYVQARKRSPGLPVGVIYGIYD